jgi:4-hydroxy-3-methylbut-2-enyl diphosphate reductase IspH
LRSFDAVIVCPGNPDDKFWIIEMAAAHKGSKQKLSKKGFQYCTMTSPIHAPSAEYHVAFWYMGANACHAGHTDHSFVPSTVAGHKRSAVNRFANNRYFSSTQKVEKIQKLQTKTQSTTKKVQWLRDRLLECTESMRLVLMEAFIPTFKG